MPLPALIQPSEPQPFTPSESQRRFLKAALAHPIASAKKVCNIAKVSPDEWVSWVDGDEFIPWILDRVARAQRLRAAPIWQALGDAAMRGEKGKGQVAAADKFLQRFDPGYKQAQEASAQGNFLALIDALAQRRKELECEVQEVKVIECEVEGPGHPGDHEVESSRGETSESERGVEMKTHPGKDLGPPANHPTPG